MSSNVWFVTGASRGFGLEIVRAALDRGDKVVAAARDPVDIERALGQRQELMPIELDVTKEEQAKAAAAAATERFGRADILVNNAGRGLLGAVEESTPEEVRSIFEVNVVGLLNVTRAILPSMRARHSGRIVNISSVGGFVARPGYGVYCATKFAVEGLSEAMEAELRPLGIRVIIVEPGAFRTDFLDSRSLQRTGREIEDYAQTVGPTRNWSDDSNHAQAGDPAKAARAIVDTATSDDPPLRLPLGRDTIDRMEEKLAMLSRELDAARDVALSTDFGETTPASTEQACRHGA